MAQVGPGQETAPPRLGLPSGQPVQAVQSFLLPRLDSHPLTFEGAGSGLLPRGTPNQPTACTGS